MNISFSNNLNSNNNIMKIFQSINKINLIIVFKNNTNNNKNFHQVIYQNQQENINH